MQRGLQGGATCRWVVIGQGLGFIWVVLRILGPFDFWLWSIFRRLVFEFGNYPYTIPLCERLMGFIWGHPPCPPGGVLDSWGLGMRGRDV